MDSQTPREQQDELDRVAGLLRDAAGQMAEAYALLRQAGAASEVRRWDDALSWQLESLKKAIDTCADLERRLTRADG